MNVIGERHIVKIWTHGDHSKLSFHIKGMSFHARGEFPEEEVKRLFPDGEGTVYYLVEIIDRWPGIKFIEPVTETEWKT